MKDKDPNELVKCEIKRIELDLLAQYYDDAVTEAVNMKSPINKAQREANAERRDELARMQDGRWKNKGTGRRRAPALEPPALQMDGNPVATNGEWSNASTT